MRRKACCDYSVTCFGAGVSVLHVHGARPREEEGYLLPVELARRKYFVEGDRVNQRRAKRREGYLGALLPLRLA